MNFSFWLEAVSVELDIASEKQDFCFCWTYLFSYYFFSDLKLWIDCSHGAIRFSLFPWSNCVREAGGRQSLQRPIIAKFRTTFEASVSPPQDCWHLSSFCLKKGTFPAFYGHQQHPWPLSLHATKPSSNKPRTYFHQACWKDRYRPSPWKEGFIIFCRTGHTMPSSQSRPKGQEND